MSKPRGDPRDDRDHPAIVRPDRRPREQRRHPACGAPAGFPIEKWDAILAINLSSAFHTTRLALPSMLRNKWGRIINIASAHGLVASPFKSAYVAAKHGMVGLTKVTALETAEQGITCNAICPGYVYTPLVEAQIGAKPRRMVFRASRSSATFCSRNSRTSVSPRSKSWARLPSSSRARPRHRSPAWHCRWMAVGPRTKRSFQAKRRSKNIDISLWSRQAHCGRKR